MNHVFEKITRYLISSLLIFILFKFVPRTSLTKKDSILLTLVIMAVYVLLDNLLLDDKCVQKCRISNREQFTGNNNDVNDIDDLSDYIDDNNDDDTDDELDEIDIEDTAEEDDELDIYTDEPKKSEIKSKKKKKSKKNKIHGMNNIMSALKSDIEIGTSRMQSRTKESKSKCRCKDDIIDNEMEYSDYNHLPIAEGYKSKDYEYGYSFLPPEKWYPQPPNPPVCVSEKKCPVCPVYTTGAPVDVKEWKSSTRVTPPDNYNVKYIKDKLNSGR